MFSASEISRLEKQLSSSSASGFSANLREEAADEGSLGDAADGEDHGAGARRDVMLAHGVHHFVKGTHDDLLQACVDFFDVPHQAFLVLYPFEVADGDAAGVGK